MEKSSITRQRTIEVISLSEPSSSSSETESELPTDLPTVLSNLRQILLTKSENDEIDSTISQHIDSIKIKIQEFNNLTQPIEIFDSVQATIKIYINDILSITKPIKILLDQSFQDIITILYSTGSAVDLPSIYENLPAYARTVCFRSFELLSLSVITDFLTDKYPVELFSCIAFVIRVIIEWIKPTIEYIVFKKNELQNQVSVIRLFLEYIDRNKQNLYDYMSLLITDIFILIWTLVDDTILVPNLLEANCSDYVLKWTSMTDLSLDIQTKCIHILHNLARHEKGVKALNAADCINILKDFKKRILDPNKNNDDDIYKELRLLYCMVISLLTEPKENREDLDNLRKILDQLMQLAIDTGQTVNNKFGGFHISEPIVVLTKLCVHDEILKYVLNESSVKRMEAKTKIEFFCRLLTKFRGAIASEDDLDQLTLIALFNILWSISFQDAYCDELKSNSKFLITVKSFAADDSLATIDQYVPNHMSSIPKAANGILWNLDENNPARAVRTAAVPEVSAKTESGTNASSGTRVMVSYCHADKDFCRQLVDGLQKDKRLDVWVDFAFCHTEDFWEEIGEAIEKANVVLFLMSKDYQDSKSCRQEVMYAKDTLKKRFIPIYVKDGFQATGWLGVRIVGPQYVRFEKKPFDDAIKALTKLIFDDKTQPESDKNKETKPPPVTEIKPTEISNNVTKPPEDNLTKPTDDKSPELDLTPPKKPVEKWTKKDIAQWFTDNHIHQQLVNVYDFQHGTDLLLYAQCLRPDWQTEYNDIKQRYQQKYNTQLYRDHFVRFVAAVHRLQPSQSKSKTCIIS